MAEHYNNLSEQTHDKLMSLLQEYKETTDPSPLVAFVLSVANKVYREAQPVLANFDTDLIKSEITR